MKKPGLTPKQQLFVNEYLVDLNATQAAIRAGYSPKRADAMGHENLRKPEIAAALMERMNKRAEQTQIDAEWVLKRLAQDATADVADLYHENGARQCMTGRWPGAPGWCLESTQCRSVSESTQKAIRSMRLCARYDWQTAPSCWR